MDDSGRTLQLRLVKAGGDGSGKLTTGGQMRAKALEYIAGRKSCWRQMTGRLMIDDTEVESRFYALKTVQKSRCIPKDRMGSNSQPWTSRSTS